MFLSNPQKLQEVEFPLARSQLEQEIENFLSGTGQTSLEVPALRFEKGETNFSFSVSSITKNIFYDILVIITKHVENVRIHSLDPNFTIFQDAGPLIKPFESIKEGIRFKFISFQTMAKVEVYKPGNFTQDELQSCLRLFQLFHPGQAKLDPAQILRNLGTRVFLPKEIQERAASQTIAETLSFPNFAGYNRVRKEVLETIILPLRHPEVFNQVARVTRGDSARNLARAVLFQGPSGVGKTTMARLIASQTGIPMIYVPVENILSKYYGESAQNLAHIFDAAAFYERAIIFVDEIDSLATSREQGLFEATRRLLSVLLRKIDGLESKEGILTIGATNRTEDLDRALLSRFDSVIHFPLPNANERAMIFQNYAHHLRSRELEALSQASHGLSGRNIEDICEYTERRWARQLIVEQKPVCPPSQSLYLEVTKAAQLQQQGRDNQAVSQN